MLDNPNEKVKCPKCDKEYNNNFDLFSIQASKRCVDCQKKWEALPENDPDNKIFEFRWTDTIRGTTRIYAKNEEEAREQFDGEVFGEGDLEIDYIDEIKKT